MVIFPDTMTSPTDHAYRRAQLAMAEMKGAIRSLLEAAGPRGLTNAQIGRTLGIYGGHIGHEGHVSRTLLALMEAEGVVQQDEKTKIWILRRNPEID